MSNKKDIFKIMGYDKFKCTADKCKFTCCSGWDINVDIKTYDKWREKENLNYLLDNVRFIKNNGENTYSIKKETKETCPLLTDEGLCNIVIKHGDKYLSKTCSTFPRIENNFEGIKELTLSCSCPEVVNIISDIKGDIYIEKNSEASYIEDLGCLKIRQALINIFKKEDITIEDKLAISYNILISILDSDDLTYEELIEFLIKCNSTNYIREELDRYKNYENKDNIKCLKEVNSLFIDIIENYRNISIFEEALKDIYKFSRKFNINDNINYWKEFNYIFKDYNELVKNCIISKILSNCINDELEELIISLEIIVLEYLFIRHALFLKYCIDTKRQINIEDIKDYIVIFSRIIENNSDAVIEFLLDIYNSDILEVEYINNLIFV